MLYRQIIYWASTVLFCGIMLFSASLYILKTDMVKGFFDSFSFPTYIVIPLAILKITGCIIIILRANKWLTEWAYAGFFFNLCLTTLAHYHAGDVVIGLSLLGLIALFPSYFLGKYLRD